MSLLGTRPGLVKKRTFRNGKLVLGKPKLHWVLTSETKEILWKMDLGSPVTGGMLIDSGSRDAGMEIRHEERLI